MYTVVMMKHKDRDTLSSVDIVTYETLSDVMIFLADNFGGDSQKFHFYRDRNIEGDFYICMKPATHNANKYDIIQVFGSKHGEIHYVN